MIMTPEQASKTIDVCVQQIESLRCGSQLGKELAIAALSAEIVEMKKICGHRDMEGTGNFVLPVPGVNNQGNVEGFDEWRKKQG